MKTKCLVPKRYLLAAFLMLIALVITCYNAGANGRRGTEQNRGSGADVFRSEHDEDPEYQEARREYLKRFFGTGPGGVPVRSYKRALAEARALPPSPLLEGRMFRSPQAPERLGWSSPIAPPIRNSYNANASAAVYSMAIDPINANVVYTGSFGGLAKTTDGGGTWRYLSDSWDSQSVSAITVNPTASNEVYVGTGREDHGPYGVGIYRSLDAGSTWSNPLGGNEFEGTFIRKIAIDPNASRSPGATTVYVANGCDQGCGLWRSDDSGITWSQLRRVWKGVYDFALDAGTQPSTLYVTENNGTYKSTDSGQSWTLIHGVLQHSRNRLSVVNSTLYLLGPGDPDHNLYKSVDRGVTWVEIPTRCPCAPNVCADPNPPEPPICADSCANRCGNIGFSVFAVDPINPQNIVAGNLALYRTDNEGITWTEIGHWWGDLEATQCIHPDQRVIAFSETASGVVYVGNDAGVVKSTDAGENWANLNQNFPGALVHGVALSRDGTMIAGTQDHGVIFSDPLLPSGRAWTSIHGGDSAHNLIDPTDSRVAYLTMYGKDFWRVTRAAPGATPGPEVPIRPPQFDKDCACNFFPTFSMNPLAPKHLVAACQRVVRTLDGTASPLVDWTMIGDGPLTPGNSYVTAATEAPNNFNVIYAVTSSDAVFVTQNANGGPGAIWNEVTPRGQTGVIHSVKVDPTNFQTAYLACDSGVFKTTDMGMGWTRSGIQNSIYHDVAIDPTNPQYVFAASNAGVFASTDGGASWGNMSQGIPAGMAVSSLSFNAASRELAASTYGRGVYLFKVGRSAQPPRGRPTPRPRP
jgi:photosystem II stability/assembly factor-like uncharacterized protein